MKTTILARPRAIALSRDDHREPLLGRFAERLVRERLAKLTDGAVLLHDRGQVTRFGGSHHAASRVATVHVRDPRFYTELAFGGSVGAGEAYMLGYWTVDDLTALVRILVRNRDALDGIDSGIARLQLPLQKALHWTARNTRRGSQRNIAAHYDLSNPFFALMLDPTMMYSSAVFDQPGMTLEEGSVAKLEQVCRKLDLRPADHVLEIGTGWGGFALHAAKHYGCRVTTTTISRRQYELAVERIAAAGLSDRITVLLADYRDLTGTYDKLVSIEMIEAVGHRYFATFFGKCSSLLEPEGMMLLQAITIADHRYEAALRSVDFIQKYIFPGCCIPSVGAMSAAVAAATDMRIFHLEDIGPHYATTLRAWRENVFARRDEVRAMGLDDTFLRMWEFYLCYCEGGFAERALGDVQMLMVKPGARPAPLAPRLPASAGN
ncbi:MAG: cyclopropane-fatty-acyl-phospholipid synthase family protein [Casimicrobiaceae bacterium]